MGSLRGGRAEAEALGFDAALAKPVRREKLLSVAMEVLGSGAESVPVDSSVAWLMMKILESTAQPMSGIGSKCSSMAKAAPYLFGTLITTNDDNGAIASLAGG